MLNFVVTKVTSDFASRIWFYLFACLGLLSFLWAPKIQGLHDYALIGIKNIKKHGCILTLYYYAWARARIGLGIIYSTYGCRHMTTPVAFLVDMV
mgnify:FL=1